MESATDSPYQPPAAEVRDQPVVKKPAPVKGVIIGLAVDQIGTLIFQLILGILYGVMLLAKGVAPEDIKQVAASLGWTSWLRISALIVGCMISVLAGYICARFARERVFRAALALSLLDVAISLALFYRHPNFAQMGLNVLTVVSVLAGAWIWSFRDRRANNSQ